MFRYLFALLLLVGLHAVSAKDKCDEISELVGAAALSKAKIADTLKKQPAKGTLNEPWRYLWFTYGGEMTKLGVSDKQQEQMFRTIGALKFANEKVDCLIFSEYFYLECKRRERGLSSVSLTAIPTAAVLECWKAANSRPELQACMEKLMTPASGKSSKKSGR